MDTDLNRENIMFGYSSVYATKERSLQGKA